MIYTHKDDTIEHMKIGFDLDKVFINTPPLIPEQLIDRLYKNRSSNILLYRIPSPIEQEFRKLTHLPIFRPPIKENIEALNKIVNKKDQLYLISSRFSFLESATNKLVKKHAFTRFFTKMYFNYKDEQPHKFKDSIIKSLHLDKYIDDDYHLLVYVAQKNPHTLFYWYNKHNIVKKITKNMYAISRLEQAIKNDHE